MQPMVGEGLQGLSWCRGKGKKDGVKYLGTWCLLEFWFQRTALARALELCWEASSGETRVETEDSRLELESGCADKLLKTKMAKALGGTTSLRTKGCAGPGQLRDTSLTTERSGLCGVELATVW